MTATVYFPASVWSDPEWMDLTAATQMFAMTCFAIGRRGGVTNARIRRVTGWDEAFIDSGRVELEASPFVAWLEGAVKRRRLPKALVESVLVRDGHACVACGSTDELQIDHVHPVKHGGSDDIGNLQTLCGTHNREKGAQLNWVMT